MSMPNRSLAILLTFAAATAAVAQDGRPVAFTNARLVTISGAVVERGTLVVKNGKIEAIGADVTAPPGARIVDATGKTILPGLVSALSRAGLQGAAPRMEEPAGGGRRRGGMPMPAMGGGGGGTQNKAATKVVDGLYGKQPVFGELLRLGITSLALTPNGGGFPGLGAVLRPDGKTVAELTANDSAFVQIGMVRDSQTKKLLKDNFDKAKKVVEDRKKPPEKAPEKPTTAPAGDGKPTEKPPEAKEPPKGEQPPKPPEPKPEPKPEPQPQPQPKPEDKPAPSQGAPATPPAAPRRPEAPKDPNIEVLADLLEGKQRAIVTIDSAADLLHWQAAVADDVKFPRTVVVQRHDALSGTIDVVLEPLKAWQCPVLLPLDLATLPRSRTLIHPAKQLSEAGIEIGFVLGDNTNAVRFAFYRLMELVRYGLPADVALKGVTLVPAKALGVDKKVGTLEVGKNADFLLFQGDPLTPSGQLESVWLGGREVPQQP